MLTDKKIINRFKLKPTDKVIDVGGSMRQREEIRVDTLLDIIRPEEAPYGAGKLKANNFVRLDITKDKFPFKDKEFDFCLCSHTLEDLPSPFLAINEMSRVAKRGVIITPSMGADMVFSHVDITDWLTGARRLPGSAHHKWFFYTRRGKMRIIPKNFPVLYTSDFQVTGFEGEKEFVYYWQGSINYEGGNDLKIHALINEYESYIKSQKTKVRRGRALFFVDSPGYFLKEFIKRVLKRGPGFKYR